MIHETLIKGDVTELRCLTEFQKRGYYCSTPFSGSCRYDVIADVNNTLYKIQCKSSSYHKEDGTLTMSLISQTLNTNGVTKHQYAKDEVDFFFTYYNEHSFLVPVGISNSCVYLRLAKPKCVINSSIHVASDYLFEKVLDEVMINNGEITQYYDNCLISTNANGEVKNWSTKELEDRFTERQIRYIKSKILNTGIAYDLYWERKPFPSI